MPRKLSFFIVTLFVYFILFITGALYQVNMLTSSLSSLYNKYDFQQFGIKYDSNNENLVPKLTIFASGGLLLRLNQLSLLVIMCCLLQSHSSSHSQALSFERSNFQLRGYFSG